MLLPPLLMDVNPARPTASSPVPARVTNTAGHHLLSPGITLTVTTAVLGILPLCPVHCASARYRSPAFVTIVVTWVITDSPLIVHSTSLTAYCTLLTSYRDPTPLTYPHLD